MPQNLKFIKYIFAKIAFLARKKQNQDFRHTSKVVPSIIEKMNCVCYNGYDGSICEQEKQKYVNVKPRQEKSIRTVVDMNNSVI